MPELPEVETIKRQLQMVALNHQITGVIFGPRARMRYPFNFQEKDILHQCILRVDRHGKNLLLGLEDKQLLINLGLTGNLQLRSAPELQKHDHLTLMLQDKLRLVLHDPRRFGYCLAYAQDTLHYISTGLDALDGAFDSPYLLHKCSYSSRAIKQILMDNKIVMGIGNIYACEILFAARLSPRRPGTSIQRTDADAIITATQQILLQAIDMGGTTFRDYRHLQGSQGNFITELKVYRQKHCYYCAQPITRIILGQRSTYFCAHCQN